MFLFTRFFSAVSEEYISDFRDKHLHKKVQTSNSVFYENQLYVNLQH